MSGISQPLFERTTGGSEMADRNKAHYNLVGDVLRSLTILIREEDDILYGYLHQWRIHVVLIEDETSWKLEYTGETRSPSYTETMDRITSHYGRNPTRSVVIDESKKNIRIYNIIQLKTVVKILRTPHYNWF